MKRVILWIAGILSVLIVLVFGYYHFILDWADRPSNNSQIYMAFVESMHDPGINYANDPKPFPNLKGLSQDSLATIRGGMGGNIDWATNYNYVSGLREDDPGDLVLMYFNRPTRWTWFAKPPTIFKEKEWIIIPVDFGIGMRPRSVQDRNHSERVSLDEFRSRLRRTLDFVRTNERPNWQTIVEEQTKFLDSVEHTSR